ncbi:MAG: MerR family transcriptional regulator [Methanosarcinales archaeon]|nr:MerR family transcriptional regulator [Methanosarcinales archaeon]
MPITINGQTYYKTLEACKLAGISKATFFRWLREGVIEDMAIKDRRGWRLFTMEDIERIKNEVVRFT